MKKLLFAALVCMMVVGFSSTASAVLLNVGDIGIPTTGAGSPGVGAAIDQILNVSFAGTDANNATWFTGKFSTWVKQTTSGTLVFEYQFSNDSGSANAIKRLSATDFTGWKTWTDEGAGGKMERGSDSTVSFYEFNIAPNTTSGLYWIETDAMYYKRGAVSIMDGGIASLTAFGPATPEPASMALLGIGLMGLCGSALRKRKMKKRFQA